ncbi:MAG: hypothetical protein LBR47_05340, partial [Spirochaetaceae bacterium]|nr:hypothetical protein [Spirochaetaceae bacterium]
ERIFFIIKEPPEINYIRKCIKLKHIFSQQLLIGDFTLSICKSVDEGGFGKLYRGEYCTKIGIC